MKRNYFKQIQLSNLIVVLFFLFSLVGLSQTEQHFSVGLESNSQYYVDDDVTGDFVEPDRFRSNNYLKIEYGIGDFSFGTQLEGYAPQRLLNFSPKLNDEINIGTYYAAYQRDKWDLTLGYFYGQFGNGLVFRSWEDRQLGINNAIRGAKVSFRPTDKISLTALYGNQRNGFEVSDGTVAGMDTNFDLSSEKTSIHLGASILNRHEELTTINEDLNPDTQLYSGRLQFAKNNFYSNLEGVVKTKDALVVDGALNDANLFFGNAVLLEMGYSKKGFGLTTTLRRMENMSTYSDRELTGNSFNEQIINYLPGLTKQHDYTLTNIYVYQAQPSLVINSSQQKAGEIGAQVDLYYKIKKGTTLGGKYGTKLALNYSNWYGLDAEYNAEFQRAKVNFLGAGKLYFRDANIEIRKKFSKTTSGIFTYVNSYYNQGVIEEKGDIVKTNTFIAETTYKLAAKSSLRLEGQHLWANGDVSTDGYDKGNWAAGTLEYNVNTNLSFYVNDMYNYGNEDETHRDHYYNIGGSYSKNKSRFALSYGRTRGGLLCVGGVCRIVPPATGLTFNLTTSF